MSLLRVFATCTVICVLSALPLQAQKATRTNWNTWVLNPANPSNPSPFALGVNDNRRVVGLADYPVKPPKFWGFVHYTSGKITYWKPANAKNSAFLGRNNVGNTVGDYLDTLGIHHAVYFHGSTQTLIVHPKAAHHSTEVIDINNLNTILGDYIDSNGAAHIFKRRSNGTFLSVPNFPGASSTSAAAFNDNGVVVGTYKPNTPLATLHGFIYRNGSFATVDYRGNTQAGTSLRGIDSRQHGARQGLPLQEWRVQRPRWPARRNRLSERYISERSHHRQYRQPRLHGQLPVSFSSPSLRRMAAAASPFFRYTECA
jgi:uncharacterized membrane protein